MSKFIEFNGMLINMDCINLVQKREEYPEIISGTHELFFIDIFVNFQDEPFSKNYIHSNNTISNFEENKKFRDLEFEKLRNCLIA